MAPRAQKNKRQDSSLNIRVSSIVMYNFGVGPRFAYVSASARAPRLDTCDTQKSLRFPPRSKMLTQNAFYYLLAPRSDIFPGGRNIWHPDQDV
jgi:hypothetical protein